MSPASSAGSSIAAKCPPYVLTNSVAVVESVGELVFLP